MKAIAIEQPWASLIALGIKDIENRDFEPSHTGRILLVAGGKEIPEYLFEEIPVEYSATIGNHILMGNLRQMDQLPLSSVIGYADITSVSAEITDETSMWGTGPIMWHLENAHIFDSPLLTGINADTHDIFEIDEIDETNLPAAHKAMLRFPEMDGTELILPLASSYYDQLMSLRYKFINFELSHAEIADFFCPNSDNFKILKHKTIKVVSDDGRTSRFEASKKTSVQTYLDDNGDSVLVPSIWTPEPIEWLVIHLALGPQIK